MSECPPVQQQDNTLHNRYNSTHNQKVFWKDRVFKNLIGKTTVKDMMSGSQEKLIQEEDKELKHNLQIKR